MGVSREEAARIMREAPPVNTSQLDVIGNVLGGVFGELVGGAAPNLHPTEPAQRQRQAGHDVAGAHNENYMRGAPTVAVPSVVQGIPVQGPENPTLLSASAGQDANVAALKPSAPPVLQHSSMETGSSMERLDWKQELKDMKALLDEGILTQEEFDVQKKRVLMQVR